MGSLIYVWPAKAFSKLPASVAEGVQCLAMLEGKKDEELARRMVLFTLRLEQFLLLSHGPELRRQYAGLVASARESGEAVLVLESPRYDEIDSMMSVIKSAAVCEAVIYHDGIGLLFLPNGSIYPQQREAEWKRAVAAKRLYDEISGFPKTVAQCIELLRSKLTPVFLAAGFLLDPPDESDPSAFSYTRTTAMGIQEIAFSIEKRYSGFCMIVPFTLRRVAVPLHDKMNEILAAVGGGGLSEVFSLLLVDIFSDDIKKTRTDLKIKEIECIEALVRDVEERVIPLANHIVTLQALDEFMNSELYPDALRLREVYAGECLMVARLSGNPQYDVIEQRLSAIKLATKSAVIMTEWNTLATYLREKVQPLL